jgi:hypothetical protein
MRRNPKDTVVGLLLIGLALIITGWMAETILFTDVGEQVTATASMDYVRTVRSYSVWMYVVGVLFVIAGGVKALRLPVAVLDTGE